MSVAVGVGALCVACATAPIRSEGGPAVTTTDMRPGTTDVVVAPPPAEVLDATVVFFDPDSAGRPGSSRAVSVITDQRALDAFERRHVDGEPALGAAARQELVAGRILIGGPVSTGCSPAEGAQLVFTAVDVRLLPIGPPPDGPDIECVRAVTSVALVAVEAAELPAGLPVVGS